MSIKYGDKSIKKVYMGDKEIKSAYMGDKLVYKNAPPLLYGTLDAGYYGRVECDNFITLVDISNQMENQGIPNPHWDQFICSYEYPSLEQYWHHFSFKKKHLYWYSIPLYNHGDSNNKIAKQIERIRWRLFGYGNKVFTENNQWGTHRIINVRGKRYYLRLMSAIKEYNSDLYTEVDGLIAPFLKPPVLTNYTGYINPNWGVNYTREQLGLGKNYEYWCDVNKNIDQHPLITTTLIENIFFYQYNYYDKYRGKFLEFYYGQPLFSANRIVFRPLLEQID
ncbi:hypothetical protein HMPREF1987_01087 [Peptostreptococcaceae bacterium oral taxon 113 str. W5053]|nr:hypothetical protein HMPREF1987_01087 [Peptostreptococcaceae bacterium oral taxon 113 str. W5053]